MIPSAFYVIPLLNTEVPTLTLWAGTVSGCVVAYGVSVLEDGGKSQRKIELLPTCMYLVHMI